MSLLLEKCGHTKFGRCSKKPYRVWVGPKSSVFWPMNMAALGAFGVSLESITRAGGVINTAGYQTLMQAFQDGQVDVAFFSGPTPTVY